MATLSDLFPGFLEDCRKRNRQRNTIIQHRNNIRITLEPLLGSRELSELLPSDAAVIIASGDQRGITRARSALTTLRRTLVYAKSCGHSIPFDLADIELPKKRRLKDPNAFTMDEINTVRTSLSPDSIIYSKHSPEKQRDKILIVRMRERCLFEVLLHTGLRLSEALSLNREQIDFVSCEMRVRNIKTGDWNTVYLHGSKKYINDYLGMRCDDNPALFISTTGKRLSYATAQSCLKRIKKRFNLPHLTHHVFRRTFVTLLLKNGCDPKETQKLARHRSLHTTLFYYYHMDDSKLKPKHLAIIGNI